MVVRVLGGGAASGIVYGFGGKAFKVSMEGNDQRAERKFQELIAMAWAAKEKELKVCKLLSFHSSLQEAADAYGLPAQFPEKEKHWGRSVLVMEEIPAFQSSVWYRVVPAEYEPGILRLYLGQEETCIDEYPELSDEQRARIHKYRKPAVGWKAARDLLGVDVAAVASDLGIFMAFLHDELSLDGADVEVQIGQNACRFVVDFSHLGSFSDADTAGKAMRVNEKFFPRAAGAGAPGAFLWKAFTDGYLQNAKSLATALKVLDQLA